MLGHSALGADQQHKRQPRAPVVIPATVVKLPEKLIRARVGTAIRAAGDSLLPKEAVWLQVRKFGFVSGGRNPGSVCV